MIQAVNTLNELYAIVNKEANEMVYVEEDQTIYMWKDEWIKVDTTAPVDTGVSLYELNQNLYNQMDPIDEFVLSGKEHGLYKFVKDTKNKYYMLLCNDLHYYTVFVLDEQENFELSYIQKEVTTCLAYMGEIKSMEPTEDGMAYEIWITTKDNLSYVFYFFPYDNGIINCR